MRRRTKVLFVFLALLATLVLARGPLYRLTVSYRPVSERRVIPLTDPVVEDRLVQRMIADQPDDIQDQIDVALKVTSSRLRFVAAHMPSDPNVFWPDDNGANCVGYSALFAALLRTELDSAGLSQRYEVKHLVGKMTFLGFDLHSIFASPFFADHDYNSIHDLETDEVWFVDPTASDYLRIRYVNSR
jgi:hypothetical protein